MGRGRRVGMSLGCGELSDGDGEEVGLGPGSGWRHVLGGLPTPLVALSAGGMHSTLLLLLLLPQK